MIPEAGSCWGQPPTGSSASRRAPGRRVEPDPVSHGGPNGDQPDDPWSPPGEPPVPGEPDPWVPNPNPGDRMDLTSRGVATGGPGPEPEPLPGEPEMPE
jgi:hypothetical protein